MSTEQRRITLTENPDGWWTAREETVDLTAQGETRDDALDEVLEAVAEERPLSDDVELQEADITEAGNSMAPRQP